MNIEVLECVHCGRKVIAVGLMADSSTRIHRHKCAGAWDVLHTIKTSVSEAEDLIEELGCLIEQENKP